MGHFQACSTESALHVEAFVRFAAIEDGLITANFLGDEVEGLDQTETELLALLVFGNGDIFDVAD